MNTDLELTYSCNPNISRNSVMWNEHRKVNMIKTNKTNSSYIRWKKLIVTTLGVLETQDIVSCYGMVSSKLDQVIQNKPYLCVIAPFIKIHYVKLGLFGFLKLWSKGDCIT